MSANAIDFSGPLIVMYHYVWPERPPEPAGVRPLLVEEFERQLDLLQSRYDICKAGEFLERIESGFGVSPMSSISPRRISDVADVELSARHGRDANATHSPRAASVKFAHPATVRRPSPRPSPGVPVGGAGRSAGGASRGDKPPCLLTFDDGTIDHATVVTPILARRGLSGVFFVLSGPATAGLMPLTHAIHWALSVGDEAVWKSLTDAAGEAGVGTGDEAEARRMYHYEPPLRAKIKYAANVALPGDVTVVALRRLAEDRGTPLEDPDGLARKWFASEEQFSAMHHAGMSLGIHGHTHRSLQQMGGGVREEMQTCAAMIRRCTGAAPKWWACPFGGSGADPSLHSAMHAAMDELGIVAGVGTESRSVLHGDDLRRLPRVDCVRLPPRSGEKW